MTDLPEVRFFNELKAPDRATATTPPKSAFTTNSNTKAIASCRNLSAATTQAPRPHKSGVRRLAAALTVQEQLMRSRFDEELNGRRQSKGRHHRFAIPGGHSRRLAPNHAARSGSRRRRFPHARQRRRVRQAIQHPARLHRLSRNAERARHRDGHHLRPEQPARANDQRHRRRRQAHRLRKASRHDHRRRRRDDRRRQTATASC